MGKDMKLLVTGALGLTGRACVEHFIAKGWDVVGIDMNLRAHFFGTKEQTPIEGVRFFGVDIRDEAAINGVFDAERFDAIIHTAGQPSHDYATDHAIEDFDINARGTLLLLEATRKYCPDATFVFCSTDKVYGENMGENSWATVRGLPSEPKGAAQVSRHFSEGATRYECDYPFDETLPLDNARDRSLFGCSKLAADAYVQEYAHKFGMKTACFRLGCITGKNHQGSSQHGFLAFLAKCIKEGTTYEVHGTGKQVRDQIHASDLAKAFDYFIQEPKQGAVYNMGGGPDRSISLLEAATAFSAATGKAANLVFGKPHRKGDRLWDVHDISKFLKDYPRFEYTYDLSDIIEELAV